LLAGLALAGALAAWYAVGPGAGDESAEALSIVREGGRHGAVSTSTRAGQAVTSATQSLQAVQAIEVALAGLQARSGFAPLSDAGRRAWSAAVTERAPGIASASSAPVAAAPAFPYQWIGRWDPTADDGDSKPPEPSAVIAGPSSTWVVRPGDLIEGQWRVEAITPTALQLTYLPLATRQTLSMASP
jgi:hypothetical protein